MDKLKLRLPVFGNLIRKVALARFASTFSELIRAGVPILRSLDIVAAATSNAVLSKAVLDSKPEVEAGNSLSLAIGASPHFPRLIVQMMSAGEKSGKMDDMLGRISDIYQDEVDATVSGLTSLIEPLLIVFLGVVVGGIVIAMFLPIFRLSEIVA
jgi:type IV pilus assembly protein PilC